MSKDKNGYSGGGEKKKKNGYSSICAGRKCTKTGGYTDSMQKYQPLAQPSEVTKAS